jgi:hypothetical protein
LSNSPKRSRVTTDSGFLVGEVLMTHLLAARILGSSDRYQAIKKRIGAKFLSSANGTLFLVGRCRNGVIQESRVSTLLLIILVLLLIGALPTWPYSSGWGYYPSGGLGLVLIILLILVLMGRV